MTVSDQLNRLVSVPNEPLRIISLVPSQTELLAYLDLNIEVVGITKFCIHPEEWHKNKTRVGGTKNISIEKVKALKPNLIIGNKEENTKSDIEELEKIAPVWLSDIFDLHGALNMIKSIGELTNREEKAMQLMHQIQKGFDTIKPLEKRVSCAYFIWKNPFYIAGKHTFIDTMISSMGMTNYTEENRYPEFQDSNNSHPEVILLSSEPYPFNNEDIQAFRVLYPNSYIELVDGELFSWYGSRLKESPSYFQKVITNIKEFIALQA